MNEDDRKLIARIQEHEADLLAIYARVYNALLNIDRAKYRAKDLQMLDDALEPPGKIAPAKAIAVLKSIQGSTGDDRIQIETFYGAPMEGTSSVGSFVREELSKLGIQYHDFWPFLYETGWARPPQEPGG